MKGGGRESMFRGVLLKGSGAWQGGRDASLAAKLVKEACTSERASELVKEIVSEVGAVPRDTPAGVKLRFLSSKLTFLSSKLTFLSSKLTYLSSKLTLAN